jgi:hypothetical protein
VAIGRILPARRGDSARTLGCTSSSGWSEATRLRRPSFRGGYAQRNVRILDESIERIGGYVSGNIFISVIAGTLAFIVLEILGVPYAAALAAWVAIADLIPGVGAMLGAVVCVIVALFSSVVDVSLWPSTSPSTSGSRTTGSCPGSWERRSTYRHRR